MTDKQPDALQYADRDHIALGDYYLRHVSAMTGEALHAKSAIAAELAHRDREIDRQHAELETRRSCTQQNKSTRPSLGCLQRPYPAVHCQESEGTLMTTNPTSGAADLPEALRSIQRFEVVDCIDDKHVPAVIPKPHGPWVRYEDHVTALKAAQPAGAQQPGAAYAEPPESLVLAVDQWFADNIKDSDGCTTQDVRELAEIFYDVTHDGGRESVDDALAIVGSFGPGIGGLNDAYARQVLLAEEVKRLREQAPNPERTGELLMGLAVIRELTGTQQKGLEETIEAVRAAVNAQKHPPAPATQQAGVALSDDLRDRLVAISEAIADQDDRAAQAMLREILKAPQPSPAAQGDALDAAFEAVRKRLCKLPRYSFALDSRSNLRRCEDKSGNWIEFDAVHALFDPVAIDAARAAQEGK